jgi:hypothetical protein
LVPFHREQVVAALFDDLGAHVPLTKHRVTENDAALDWQNAQQLESSLVFIGLGLDANLGEHGLVFMSVRGHEMVARHRAVATAA